MKINSIGFTGTQVGCTPIQLTYLEKILQNISFQSIHVGDCVGADQQFYNLAVKLYPQIETVGHIPDKSNKRAFCKYTQEKIPKPYLDRNHDIVDESQLMIATPKEEDEVLRSGTWATIRYAIKRNKHLIILFPSGRSKHYKNYANKTKEN